MTELLTLLIPSLVPVASDAVRSIVARLTGGAGAQPQNVDEAIKLMSAETDKLKALAELDKPTGEVSRWVSDLRASFRYVAASVVILAAVGTLFIDVGEARADLVWQAAGSVWAFIFGDRMYSYMRKK